MWSWNRLTQVFLEIIEPIICTIHLFHSILFFPLVHEILIYVRFIIIHKKIYYLYLYLWYLYNLEWNEMWYVKLGLSKREGRCNLLQIFISCLGVWPFSVCFYYYHYYYYYIVDCRIWFSCYRRNAKIFVRITLPIESSHLSFIVNLVQSSFIIGCHSMPRKFSSWLCMQRSECACIAVFSLRMYVSQSLIRERIRMRNTNLFAWISYCAHVHHHHSLHSVVCQLKVSSSFIRHAIGISLSFFSPSSL